MRFSTLALATLAVLGAFAAPRAHAQPAPDPAAHAAPAPQATPGSTAALTGAAVPSVAHPAWSRNANIYEVNVRQYTPEGTLAAIRPHLARLQHLGVDILWFMPVQPIGKKNRKGRLGSYYSIADYRAINPEFGTTADFRALVADAHRLGMKVLLDWVPNHTAFDHPWITQHPDWYVHRADGSIMNARDNENHETDWTDVAELNYDNADLRRAMLADMRYWLDSAGVDGFRCDVAGGVPDDFWAHARATLGAAHPGLFMLAEAESPSMHASFDMTYGWQLYDLLVAVSQGKQSPAAIDRYLAAQDSTYPADAYRMYFTVNHDKNSWDGTEFERMGPNNTPSYILSATLRNSMPLLYTGQEVSNPKRLRFFERDTVDWRGPSRAAFYRAVFALKHAQPALANGAAGGVQQKLATDDTAHVYAFTRTRGANTVLVAVNYGDAAVRVPYRGLARGGAYTDWFAGTRVRLGERGVLAVPAHGYRVLVR